MASFLFPAGQASLGLDGDDFDAIYNYFIDESAGQSIAGIEEEILNPPIDINDAADGTNDHANTFSNRGIQQHDQPNDVTLNAKHILDATGDQTEGHTSKDTTISNAPAHSTIPPSFSELSNDEKQDIFVKYLYEHKDDGTFNNIFDKHPKLLAHALRTLDDDENVLYKFLSKHRDIVGKFLERHNNITVLAEFLEKYPAAMHHILDEERAILENFLRNKPEALHLYLDSNSDALHHYLKSSPGKIQAYLRSDPEVINDFCNTNPELAATWLQNWQSPTDDAATINPQLLMSDQSILDSEHLFTAQGSDEHLEGFVSPHSPFLGIDTDTQIHSSSQFPIPSSQTTLLEQEDLDDNEITYMTDMSDQEYHSPSTKMNNDKNKVTAGSVNKEVQNDSQTQHSADTQTPSAVGTKYNTKNLETSSDDNDDSDDIPPCLFPTGISAIPITKPPGVVKHQPRTARSVLNARKTRKILPDSEDEYDNNNDDLGEDDDDDYNDDNDDDVDFNPAPKRASSALITAAMTPIQRQPSLVPRTTTTTSVATSTIIAPTSSVTAISPGTTVVDPDYRLMNIQNITIAYIPYPAPATALATDKSKQRGTKREWALWEEDCAIKHMLDVRDEGKITGENRFNEVAKRLNAESNGERTWTSVKNFWNRAGRVRSGFDERRCKKAPLATSLQGKHKKKAGRAGAAARVVGGGLAVVAPAPARRGRKRKVKVEKEEDGEDEDEDEEEEEEEEEEEYNPERDEARARALCFGTRQKKKVKYTF